MVSIGSFWQLRNARDKCWRSRFGLVPCLVGVALWLASMPICAQTLSTLFTNGPVANRVNIVLLAEGYQTNQMTKFLADAETVVGNLLSAAPYSQYSNYFNAYAIFAASADSGSDHPPALKNTYFNSSYDSFGLSQLITIPPNNFDGDARHGKGKVLNLLTNLFPDYDIPILVVNDTAFGGSGNTPDTPEPIIITSLNSTPAGRDIVAHESGHLVGGLADEYSNGAPSGYVPVERPNSTAQTNRDLVKWRAWIDDGTPTPTPPTLTFMDFVGLFEGAQYQTNGWYRPKLDCKMNHLGAAFCEVCSEQLVKSIYGMIREVDSFSPAITNLTVSGAQVLSFSVTPLRPVSHKLAVQWYTNGVIVAGATNSSFQLSSESLGDGKHSIMAQVSDPTPLVRDDPAGRLTGGKIWWLNVNVTPLSLSQVRYLSGTRFRFTVSGNAPQGCVIETSTNLADWTPISTNTLAGGQLDFTNVDVAIGPARFYRASTLP